MVHRIFFRKEYIDPSRSVEAVFEAIHAQGGIAVAPHPHRGMLEGARELMHLWDNHERRRLFSWKSLIHCEKKPRSDQG